MSAASLDPESSQSSSGYEDGLGRRVLVFDRETGDMLERLVLRPELSAFEAALRKRIAIVAGLEDERFARPRSIERDAQEHLTVVSEYIAGHRLSDVLDAAAEHGIVAGLDAGLGLLLELLPALARLHDAGLAHGALAAGRVMISPAGQLVLLDSIYAEPLERLKLTRRRLWSEFRLVFPASAGSARFDKSADLGHAAMIAAALTLGRPLQDDDYPDGIPALRQEIVEIASIRGSKTFADSVDKVFAGALPIAGRKAPISADEAAIDLRKLVRKELGITTCRTALLEFFQQVEAAEAERIAGESAQQEARAREEAGRVERKRADNARERIEAERVERERAEEVQERAEKVRLKAERKAQEEARERAEAARLEAERLERERLEAERAEAKRIEKARLEAERLEHERQEKARLEAERLERERAEKARLEQERLEAERVERERAENEARERAESKVRERIAAEKARLEAERVEHARAEKARLEAERKERERAEKARIEAERLEREQADKARLEAERLERDRLETERRERVEHERAEKARELLEAARAAREQAGKARLELERAEKARLEAERLEQERAAQARLDAEREALNEARERAERARIEAERVAIDARKREQERAVAAPAPAAAGWLIPPDRASKFEQPVEEAPPPAPTARTYPIYVPPAEPESWTPNPPLSAPTVAKVEPVGDVSPGLASPDSGPVRPASKAGPIRLKDDANGGTVSARATVSARTHADRHEPESLSAAGAYEPFGTHKAAQPIPWKLIATGVVLIAVSVAIRFGFTPSDTSIMQAVRKTAAPAAAPPVAAPPAGRAGRLAITTQPAGAHVTIDGKPAGETPLTLDSLSAGRHVVTITGASGASAKRTIRVEPGRTTAIDLPLYSGFANISAPFVLEISEKGKALGVSDEQILLTPGTHTLRLTNQELGYTTTETVEIQPGEVTHIALDPHGRVNINAAPWAEVYIDGEKAGDTPLANVSVRLGVREFVFKNPQFGERKVVSTITANGPATVSVDFNK
jgi:hypothetical protein